MDFEDSIYHPTMEKENLYQFSINTLTGKDFDLKSLKGKKVMLVNTASECGLTPQYEQLQELYSEYGGTDFEILGFPCNDFGAQEPGKADEIADAVVWLASDNTRFITGQTITLDGGTSL